MYKRQVLRAVVRHASQKTLDKVWDAWEGEDALDAKLTHYFEHGPLAWYDTIQAAPDAAELLDGIHTTAAEEMSHAASIWRDRFEKLIIQHSRTDHQIDAAELADFIYSTSVSAKTDAANRDALVKRLGILKKSVMALIG